MNGVFAPIFKVEAVARRCSVKTLFLNILPIYWKTLVLESLFSIAVFSVNFAQFLRTLVFIERLQSKQSKLKKNHDPASTK